MNRSHRPTADLPVTGMPLTALGRAFAGLLAAAAGLAVAELAAALVPDGVSLLTAVGDEVIARFPAGPREQVVETVGTNDKPLLITAIVVAVLLVAALLGLPRDTRLRPLAAGTLGLSVIGGWAGARAPTGSVPAAILVATSAAIVTAVALRVLRGTWPVLGPTQSRLADPGSAERDAPPEASRRRFLIAAASMAALTTAATAASVVVRDIAAAPIEALRRRSRLPIPSNGLPPVPIDTAVAGLDPVLTPNAEFFRIDTALRTPVVDPRTWTLRVHGMVDRPLTLTFADLQALPQTEADVTLTCVGNEVGGRLVGTARWQGVPLAALLERVGVTRLADQVVGRSIDGFTAGFPLRYAIDGRSTLIATGMNGEPLPFEHGYPARLVVPGLFGYVSATKWLTEIELTTFARFDAYWRRRGWSLPEPILTQSRIDLPRRGTQIPSGRVTVAGVAWAQHRGISRVEISVDRGPWQRARLARPLSLDTWRLWSFAWDAIPGAHTLQVRATDGAGQLQRIGKRQPFPSGATGWHIIPVEVL